MSCYVITPPELEVLDEISATEGFGVLSSDAMLLARVECIGSLMTWGSPSRVFKIGAKLRKGIIGVQQYHQYWCINRYL